MTIIQITRSAKCKDCKNITLQNQGKRKRFVCDLGHSLLKGKESKICQNDYNPKLEYHIKESKL